MRKFIITAVLIFALLLTSAAIAGKIFLSTDVIVFVTPAEHNLSFWIESSCNQSFVTPLYFTGIAQGETGEFPFYIRNESQVPVTVNASLTKVDWADIYFNPSTNPFTIQPGQVYKETLVVRVKLDAPLGERERFRVEFGE